MTDYGPSDVSTTNLSQNQFPISEVYVPNVGLKALGGGPKQTDSTNKDYAPMLLYMPDGNDLAEGATTDAAVTGDTSGSLSAKLRGLSKILSDIWDSVNHRIKVDGSGVIQPVRGAFAELTGLSATSGSYDLVPSTDVSAYKWLSLQVTGTWSGTLYFQVSNDGIHWQYTMLEPSDSTNTSANTITGAPYNAIFEGPVRTHYFKASFNDINGTNHYNSGTANGVLDLFANPAGMLIESGFVTLNGGQNLIGYTDNDGFHATVIAAGTATDTQIAAGNGHMLGIILVTATGTNPLQVFDSTTPIGGGAAQMGALPASPALGPYPHHTWSVTGNITVKGNSNNPAVTIYWS